ncbi:MAG: acyltransferase family protein [Pseudomonadota bacterium]
MKFQRNNQYDNLTYRPDIDGLRAIAVVAVILYHLFPESITSGFLGVDVFFVISGFLITTILLNKIKNNTFSLAHFYMRRVLRIFPALILVLITCLLLGWFLLFPYEYQFLGKHVLAGATFISNFVLWSELGYFDTDASTKPLLHLWSLAIEEQFYIFWPILLWTIYKTRFNILIVLTILCLASFLLLFIGTFGSSGNFYFPASRFWELLAGALLTQIKTDFWPYGKFLRHILGALGISAIVVSFILFKSTSVLPGMGSLLPVIGTMLVIAVGSHSIINKSVLSSSVFVWFGKISYPLYLWHWIFLVFAGYYFVEITYIQKLLVLGASILISALTFYCIEKPIRYTNSIKKNSMILSVLMILVGGAGFFIYLTQGIESRFKNFGLNGDVGQNYFFNFMKENFYYCKDNKIFERTESVYGITRCFQSQPNNNVEVVLIGDSHVEHLFIGFASILKNKNVAYYTRSNLPFANEKNFKHVFDSIFQSKSIDTVIIAADWVGRIHNKNLTESNSNLSKTIAQLKSKDINVYLISNAPKFEFHAQKCKWGEYLRNNSYCFKEKSADDIRSFILLEKNMKLLHNIQSYSLDSIFCDNAICKMNDKENIFYRDSNHLNINGSILVAQRIIDRFPSLRQ